MTILQKPRRSGEGHAARFWHRFGGGAQVVRHTDAWEHETFAEEQARWERRDPEYARICDDVRRARDLGEEASRRADEAKSEWDARVARERQASDAAQRAHHALEADQTRRRRPASSRAAFQRAQSRSLKSIRTARLAIRAREGHHHVQSAPAAPRGERAGRESVSWPD
jgi:hypothetical protein